MAYSSDPTIENFFKTYGAAGDVYNLPQNFNGDYLAVVNANVNGGKSDLYVSEKLDWTSQIGADGTFTDGLVIDRKDTANTSLIGGTKRKIRFIFRPSFRRAVLLRNESGGVPVKIYPKVNYVADGYSTDPLVAAIESSTQTLFSYPAVATHEEDGKRGFRDWSKVSAGASTELSFNYAHHAFAPPAPGVVYQFIFEKQAGTNRITLLRLTRRSAINSLKRGCPRGPTKRTISPGGWW